jgi:hypothetical protein
MKVIIEIDIIINNEVLLLFMSDFLLHFIKNMLPTTRKTPVKILFKLEDLLY